MGVIIHILVVAAAVYALARIVPGVYLRGFKSAIFVALAFAVLGFLYARVFGFITWPIQALEYVTLGLFSLVVNAVLLMLAAKLVSGFHVARFRSALLMSVGVSLVELLVSAALSS